MKNEDWNKLEKIVFVSLAVMLVTVLLSIVLSNKTSFEADCEVSGINYVDIKEGGAKECWLPNANKYCPLPEKLKCKVSGELPTYLVPSEKDLEELR